MSLLRKIFCKQKQQTRATWPAPPPRKPKKMQVDVSFQFAKVYNIEKFDVVIGQKFSLFTDSDVPVAWFSNKDAALEILESDTSAEATATALGESIIFIFNEALTELIKKLTINVVEAIVEPAKTLNPSAGKPEPK